HRDPPVQSACPRALPPAQLFQRQGGRRGLRLRRRQLPLRARRGPAPPGARRLTPDPSQVLQHRITTRPSMDLRKLKKLIELLEESNLSEIEIKEGEESVRLSRGSGGGAPVVYAQAPVAAPGGRGAEPVMPMLSPVDGAAGGRAQAEP